MTRIEYLHSLASQRILLLDGAMGTMIQSLKLRDEDFALGFESSLGQMRCNEVLSLTRPDVIFDIHRQYLESGADIIETNTFGANRFSLEHYGLADQDYDLNLAAAEIARAAVEEYEQNHPDAYAFVAGVLGPTGSSASFSPSVDDPLYRLHTYDEFMQMYVRQIEGLLDGNVDLLLIETVFDTLVAKAALAAAFDVFEKRGASIPLMVSATFSDASGRTLSAQSIEAFIASMSAYPLFSLGLNCSLGTSQMEPLIRTLAQLSPFRTSAHPNAGLPELDGTYRETAKQMASAMEPLLHQGLLSIVGGCCGTTPLHIEKLAEIAKDSPVRKTPELPSSMFLSGWDLQLAGPGAPFVVVGERTNVSGSMKFAKIIREGRFSDALSIASEQIAQGAMVIDVCMDDPMIDQSASMVKFLRLASTEPSVAKVPVMIDSSFWEVIHSALSEIQGRCIVNSISLKDGNDVFLQKARYIASRGAAVVVMLFDERGQADTFERKCEIAKRVYDLLITGKIFPPYSVIIDPNIMAIATGIDEHDLYARDFLRAVTWIKTHCPGVLVSGGISNLSFAFRKHDVLRNAIHAVFLRLAVEAGLDMAIMNPSAFVSDSYPEPEIELIIRKALLAEDSNRVSSRNELIALTERLDNGKKDTKSKDARILLLEQMEPVQRLTEAIIQGIDTYVAKDLQDLGTMEAVSIIEGPLMCGMKQVGRLFGDGNIFLPHVVKSARVMKSAVDLLRPRLETASLIQSRRAGTIVMATVRGDVHDIGKNIVSLVLRCNNFEVIDLGVMVDGQTILNSCLANRADLVCLSGLISPSLAEMAQVCRLFEQHAMQIPILIGGATVTEEYTAVKLHPLYHGGVLYGKDAAEAVTIALNLMSDRRQSWIRKIAQSYESIAKWSQEKRLNERLSPIDMARARRFVKTIPAPKPDMIGTVVCDASLQDLFDLINWNMFLAPWKVKADSDEGKSIIRDAKKLLRDTNHAAVFQSAIKAVVGIFPAAAEQEVVRVYDSDGKRVLAAIQFARSQKDGESNSYSLADFIVHQATRGDYIGMFAATAGIGIREFAERFREDDEYHYMLIMLLADRLAEAFSAYLHERMANHWWKFGDTTSIRPAIGFPADPDHSHKRIVFDLLDVENKTGIELTESYAMDPPASVCGFYFVGNGVSYGALGHIGDDQIASWNQDDNRTQALKDSYETMLWSKKHSNVMMDVNEERDR
ncbi:MAG: methionine synthase [Sphaerochaetaceae bacterium]|nr:methionine synthase [Sphaerochaetaceae bacterium]